MEIDLNTKEIKTTTKTKVFWGNKNNVTAEETC